MSDKKQKFSIEEAKKIPPVLLLRLINRAKKSLKRNEVMKKICNDYGVDIDIIDLFPTAFADLDVSARTEHGVVYLNYKLLCDGDFDKKDVSYLTHEYTHCFQQCFGDKPTKSADDGEYLDNPYEIEGFRNQVEYLADELGEPEAEKYVDNLLDHHDLDGEEAEEKKDELMVQVE